MRTTPIALYGPSTMPRDERPSALRLHIAASLKALADRRRDVSTLHRTSAAQPSFHS